MKPKTIEAMLKHSLKRMLAKHAGETARMGESGVKLKPCPFCGSETSPYAVRSQDGEEGYVICASHRGGCGALTGGYKSGFVERWNMRAESERLQGALDWLKNESIMLGNLLSVIHRDGGQYVRGVGVAQACIDAETIVAGMNIQIEAVDNLIQQAVLAEREACADLCEDAFDKLEDEGRMIGIPIVKGNQ